MKIFEIKYLLPPKEDKQTIATGYVVASHIMNVWDFLQTDLNDKATTILSIAEIAPILKILD